MKHLLRPSEFKWLLFWLLTCAAAFVAQIIGGWPH